MTRQTSPVRNMAAPELLALPGALFAAIIFCSLTGVPTILVWLTGMVFHELGHAIIYWLNSEFAIPTFGATLPLQSHSSALTFLGLSAFLGYWGRFGFRNGYSVFFFGAIILEFAMCVVTLAVPRATVEEVMLYGGLGGEIYLGAAATLLFYAELPNFANWNTNRYLFLILGAVSYVGGAMRWFRIRAHKEKLPLGGLFDVGAISGGDSSGDLDRLMREFHWTPEGIVSTYIHTFWVTTALLAAAALTILAIAALRTGQTLDEGVSPHAVERD